MPKENSHFDIRRWALGIAGTVIAAMLIGLGSTAWNLYNRVHAVEKENVRIEGELAAAEKVNEAQQKEIDRLWDGLSELWRDTSDMARNQR